MTQVSAERRLVDCTRVSLGATENNFYLDGLGAMPENASRDAATTDGSHIYLWMSDYHPDGAQLFWPLEPTPFTVCLGLRGYGDDIRPAHMVAFRVPEGKGVYLHPGTWHNGVYLPPHHAPCRFLTRQGRVHARVSCSWAEEFGTLLRRAGAAARLVLGGCPFEKNFPRDPP